MLHNIKVYVFVEHLYVLTTVHRLCLVYVIALAPVKDFGRALFYAWLVTNPTIVTNH